MERLTITRGDTRQILVTLTNPDGTAWEDPGSVEIRCTGKRRRTDTDDDAVFAKSLNAGITLDDNVATVTLAPDDTDTLTANGSPVSIYCDIQVDESHNGPPMTVAKFLLVVEPDVTRTNSLPV